MNSQHDDYLKHSPHWIYANLCSWNTGRGQKENKEFENCYFQNTLFTLSTLSNIYYPILPQSGYFSHWTRWLNSFIFITLLQFFNEYDTDTNCNNCVSQKWLIGCLRTFNKLFISYNTFWSESRHLFLLL